MAKTVSSSNNNIDQPCVAISLIQAEHHESTPFDFRRSRESSVLYGALFCDAHIA